MTKLKKTLFLSLILLVFPGVVLAIDLKTSAQDAYPKFFVDSAGKMNGLIIDIMRAIEQEIPGLRFVGMSSDEIEFVPWRRMQNDIESGRSDVIFGLAKSEKRIKKGFVFIDTPLYTVNHIVAVRRDDDIEVGSFKDIENLGSDGIILTIPASSTYGFLMKQKYDLIVDCGARTVNQNFEKLINGRGRFFYYHDLGILSNINQKGLRGKVKALPTIFHTYTHHMAFSKTIPASTVQVIEQALKKLMAEGKLKAIYTNYME